MEEQKREQWQAEFRSRLAGMRGFFAGLNPELGEEQALRELLEEVEFMAAPLHERLQELQGAHDGSGQ